MMIAADGSALTEDFGQTVAGRWRDLREWLSLVDAHDELKVIKAPVDPREELSAIAIMSAQKANSAALLFDNFPDNPFDARILVNMLGASKMRFALTVGIDPRLSLREMVHVTRRIVKARIPPIRVAKSDAPVNDVVLRGNDVDLTKLPVPTFWPRDGGPFIGSGAVTLTRHPSGGRINAGIYRQQLFDKALVGLNCVPGRHGLADCEAAWAQGKPAEIVTAYGVDPALFIVGSQRYGAEESELDAAGGLMGMPVELTEAEIVSLPIPARAEIVIEGLAYPGDTRIEGPLGEFHGFYGGTSRPNPVIQVQAVHMRKRPIMTAAIMANYPAGEMGDFFAIMRSARILDDLDRLQVPGVKSVYCHPAAAAGQGMVVVAIDQRYVGHSSQILSLAAHVPAATFYTKWIVAVDGDVDPTNIDDVLWALAVRCNPADDVTFLKNTMSFRADPSVAPNDKPFGSKILIDACVPYRWINDQPKRALLRRGTYEKVVARWEELGFNGEAPQIMALDDF